MKYHTGDSVDVWRVGGESTYHALIMGAGMECGHVVYDLLDDYGGKRWAYEEQIDLVESWEQRRQYTAAMYAEMQP